MGSTDDQFKTGGKSKGRPICFAGSDLGDKCHVCAFFNSRDDEYRALIPFISEGIERGEKIVHTIDPERREDHLARLHAEGLDAAHLERTGQFELRTWSNTHLAGGKFDPVRTLSLFEDVVKKAKQEGYPLIRFVTHMEWALMDKPGIDELLEYEAKANAIWMQQSGPVNPVICTYDLTRFSGETVIDVMRTHPMTVIGGVLQENPFFVPPEDFIHELRERRTGSGRR
ncbi:MAG: MEDS domain-containing protein [Verrucomicrobia bacterium]|nr:MEDS domain-containing protein [Verrucomicrobiota bacterium]